jgi:sigma-B regulation protein RsbU (phosphoserine phosphatase)
MRTVLIAEDEPVDRRHIEASLESWGYSVLSTTDGLEALEAWDVERPDLAILDWLMPKMDGLTLCRAVRARPELGHPYIIMLTARTTTEDVVRGLGAGADDFLKKPFEQAELKARLSVGERMLDLQGRLAQRVRDLEEALSQVKVLQGIIPICMYCKRVRDEREYWEKVEEYVSKRSDARFSHGICPECLRNVDEG